MKKFLLVSAICLFVLALGSFATFWSLSQQTPEFYVEALESTVTPEVRKETARKLVEQAIQLAEEIQHSEMWEEEFTDEQINSWLAEEFDAFRTDWLPDSVQEPRIKIEEGKLLLAFQFEHENIQGVVSCELRPSLGDPNQLSIAVRSVRVGRIPIPLETLLDALSGSSTIEGWKITWERDEGEADMIRVTMDQGEPIQPILQTLELTSGVMRVAGVRGPLHSAEPVPATVQETAQLMQRRLPPM